MAASSSISRFCVAFSCLTQLLLTQLSGLNAFPASDLGPAAEQQQPTADFQRRAVLFYTEHLAELAAATQASTLKRAEVELKARGQQVLSGSQLAAGVHEVSPQATANLPSLAPGPKTEQVGPGQQGGVLDQPQPQGQPKLEKDTKKKKKKQRKSGGQAGDEAGGPWWMQNGVFNTHPFLKDMRKQGSGEVPGGNPNTLSSLPAPLLMHPAWMDGRLWLPMRSGASEGDDWRSRVNMFNIKTQLPNQIGWSPYHDRSA